MIDFCKKLRSLAFLLLILITSCKPEIEEKRIVVEGVFENFEERKADFGYEIFELFKSKESESLVVNEDGSFKMVLNSANALEGFFSLGKVPIVEEYTIELVEGGDSTLSTETFDFRMVYLYLEPGDSINMSLDVNEIDKSLSFTGRGAENNRFVNEMDREFNNYMLKYLFNYYNLTYRKPNDYKSVIDNHRSLKIDYISSYTGSNGISPALSELYLLRSEYGAIADKLRYPGSNEYFNKGVKPDLPTDYYMFLDSIVLVDNIGSRGIGYYYQLKSIFDRLHKLESPDSDYYEFVESRLEGRDYYEFVALSLNRDFKKSLYDLFGKDCPYPDISKKVVEKYAHLEGMLKGSPAPEFELKDNSGQLIRSESLVGKYMYIDFWATWCKPCINEIPALEELQEQYREKNIHFVSISIDKAEDEGKWLNFVEENQLQGIQLYADEESKSELSRSLNITLIPRFVLIDPDGNILDASAPRPSSPELVELFQSLDL